jgi:hypothetical protein
VREKSFTLRKRVEVTGTIHNPTETIGISNIAVLKAPTRFILPNGDCSIALTMGEHPMSLISKGEAVFSGFITGKGPVQFEMASEHPLELAGPSNSAYQGTTVFARGVIKLNKPAQANAIPGNLILGGSEPFHKDNAIILGADGQIASSSEVTLQGTQPVHLDLSGHQVAFSKLHLSTTAKVRTGPAGVLRVKQLYVNDQRLKDGEYRAPQSWNEGNGVAIVDRRVQRAGKPGTVRNHDRFRECG